MDNAMKLIPYDIYTYYRPSKCGLRIALKQQGVEEAQPGPFEQILKHLGEEHEKKHLATFPTVIDVSSGTPQERLLRTQQVVGNETPVVYHALFRSTKQIAEVNCEILGEPDFLICDAGGRYVIRDSKISKRINNKEHPEIVLQMGIYGWLYEQTFSQPPAGLQVHSGTGDIVEIPYDGGSAALELLEEILGYKQATAELYSPVGWSKCNVCAFYNHCWPQAEKNQDVAMVVGVDQGLAWALREQGVETVDELLASFDEEKLAEFSRPWGKKSRRVGKDAGSILRMARAVTTGEEILLQTPAIPDYPNYVMFDLEGLPPHLDEVEKIYLWGMQAFGDKPSKYMAATAGFGIEGDQQGWEDFLEIANRIFSEYGDIPFVHWHDYERIRVRKYVERFGDHKGIAARVQENLLDLLPIAKKSIALPLASYSLKVVEQYIGFERTQEEFGGDWAMAKYIEATELVDKQQRDEVMDEILTYNNEDLEATWSVLQWLISKSS